MSCNTLCGCGTPVGILNDYKKPLDPCWVKYEFSNRTGSYTLPRAGLYQVMLSSNGADIHKALELENGTAFIIADLSANTKVTYSLGDTSSATVGKYVLNTPAVENTSGKTAGLVIRYVGEKWNSSTPYYVLTEEFYRRSSPEWRSLRFSDGKNPWADLSEYFITPGENWTDYPNMKEHWYYADVNFPTTGDYTFYVMGDDVGQLLVDGKPVVWGKPSSSNAVGRTLSGGGIGSPVSAGGHVTLHVEQGVHQVIVYNKQTGGYLDGNVQAIFNSEGANILDYKLFKKIEKTTGCNNDPVIPLLSHNTDGYYVAGDGTSTNM